MARAEHFTHGYVVGVLVTSKGDGGDAGRLPDAVGATSLRLKFTRKTPRYRLPFDQRSEAGAYGALVQHETVHAAVRPDGYITSDLIGGEVADPTGTPGIWLVVGVYRVDFGDFFPAFDIEVTAEHTEENPLDLYSATPYVPEPGVPVTTVLLPAGANVGDVLTWGSDGLEWGAGGSGGGGSAPDASTTVKGIVQLTNHLGGTATAPTVRAASTTQTGIVELATNTEATTGTDTSRAVTPSGVKAVVDARATDYATAAQGTKADAAIPSGLVDAKGDLIVATADNTVTRLPAGSNGHVLTADSAESAGVKWAAPAGGGGAVDVDVSDSVALWPLTPTGGTTARYGTSGAQSIASAWLPHGVTVHRLIITCVAAESGGEMYVRLYQGFDSTDTVAAVTEVVTFDLSATGTVSVALSAPVDLDPGPFFIGWAHDDATSATVRSGVTNAMLAAAVSSAALSSRASRSLFGSSGSSLPTTASISSSSASNNNAPPAIGLGLA